MFRGMFRSIRWSLLVWQAVILAAVIGGFGIWLYRWSGRAWLKEVDGELLGVAQVLAKDVRTPPNGPVQAAIPPQYLRRFGKRGADQPYFVIWNMNGEVLASSLPAGDVPRPEPRKGGGPHPWRHRTREGVREVVFDPSERVQILAGKSTRRERSRLERLRWQILSAGGGLFLVGMAGSGILVHRALRPIQRITRTAESISAANLSRRIDLGGTHNELGRLAAVLNDAFARLEDAFGQQVRFTADASHELRTPVAVILAQTELSLEGERSQDAYRAALEVCQRAAGRMKTLIEDLLRLAKADAGRLRLRCEPFPLHETVRRCIDLVRPLAAQRDVAVRDDLQPLVVSGDSAMLGEAVQNVLDNAVTYNRSGGSVSVSVRGEGEKAVVTVADTGIGIAHEDLEKVFDRFYRANKARSRERGGSGLGLAIARDIIRAHGGDIELTSSPGEGTTVVLTLPQTVRAERP